MLRLSDRASHLPELPWSPQATNSPRHTSCFFQARATFLPCDGCLATAAPCCVSVGGGCFSLGAAVASLD
eukprot:7974379-Alexandrium_andersonii.AAC.1